MINTKLDYLLLRPAIFSSLLTTLFQKYFKRSNIYEFHRLSNFRNISYKTSHPDLPRREKKRRYVNRTAQFLSAKKSS